MQQLANGYDSVRVLLESFEPADDAERGQLPRFADLLAKPNPADRHDYVPGHLTASALVTVGRGADTKVLLIFHKKLQRWLQPGGHVEPGEFDLRESARRELLEETGLELPVRDFLPIDIDIHEIPASSKHPAHLHYDIRFAAQATSETLPTTAVDFCDARWFRLDEVTQLAATDGGLLRMAQRAVARLTA